MATDSMTVKITPNDRGNPAGKLADAESQAGQALAGARTLRFPEGFFGLGDDELP